MRKSKKGWPALILVLFWFFAGFGLNAQVTQATLERVTDSRVFPANLGVNPTIIPTSNGGVCVSSGVHIAKWAPPENPILVDGAELSGSATRWSNPSPRYQFSLLAGVASCEASQESYVRYDNGQTYLMGFRRIVTATGRELRDPNGVLLGRTEDAFALLGQDFYGVYYYPLEAPTKLHQGMVVFRPSGSVDELFGHTKVSDGQWTALSADGQFVWILDPQKGEIRRIRRGAPNAVSTVFTGVASARVASAPLSTLVAYQNPRGIQVSRFRNRAFPLDPMEEKIAVDGKIGAQSIIGFTDLSGIDDGPIYAIVQLRTGVSTLIRVSNGAVVVELLSETGGAQFQKVVASGSELYLSQRLSGGQITLNRVVTQSAPPQITAVTNAASGQILSGVAKATWITLWGSSFADRTEAASSVPFPEVLGGVRVLFRRPSDNALLSAPLWYVGPGQINAFVPDGIGEESFTDVYVKLDGKPIESNRIRLDVVPSSPGLSLYGGALLLQDPFTFRVLGPEEPLPAGQWVTSYGTGFGATTPSAPFNAPAPANVLRHVSSGCRLEVGSQLAEVAFCGLTPGAVGLFQLNWRHSLPPSGTRKVEAKLTVGGQTSTASLTVP